MGGIVVIVIIVVIVLFILTSTVKIVQEYERGVIFRLGRLVGARGPGLFLIIPFVERMVKVDLRILTLDVPSQECITSDTVTVRVNAVLYFKVTNPSSAVVAVLDYIRATSLISQTTLRSVLGETDLDTLLTQREKVNAELQKIIDDATEPWGVKVTSVEVKDVELPANMQRALARQAEAERERRAKIIHAEGEAQAAEQLTAAAAVLSTQPAALQLRYLATIAEVASEKTSTFIVPLPIDILTPFLNHFNKDESDSSKSAK
jgi:regulator of protease activity HflC (stomatin/prohibitin superfamily)